MTDDELIQRIRASLNAAVAGADPPANLTARLRASLAQDDRPLRGHPGALRPRSAGRRLRAGARVVPVVLTIGVTVAIAAIALVTLGHRHPSAPGPAASPSAPPPYVPPNDPAMKYVMPVTNPGPGKQYPACRIGRVVRGRRGESVLGLLNRFNGSPTISHAAPTELLPILGVLRRPATPSDKLPPRFPLVRVAQGSAQVIYVDYIRLARVRDGVRYYLIPVVSAGDGIGVSPACAAAEMAALHRELPHIPQALRAHAKQVLADLIAEQRYHSHPHQAIWELDVSHGGGSASSGGGGIAWDITHGEAMGSSGSNGNATVTGVVPDAVATITFRYLGGPHGTTSITTRPINNVFVYRAPRTSPTAFPNLIIWRNAHGKIIKTLSENDN